MSARINRLRELMIDTATAVTALCAVVLTGFALHSRVLAPPNAAAISPDSRDRPIAHWQELLSGGRRVGPPKAPLTILEFGDFECPACGSFERTLTAFRSEHRDAVSLVFRHWPLPYHRMAYALAEAAECAASQGRFAEFHDFAFAKQDSLATLAPDHIALRIGVPDLVRFDRCLGDSTTNLAIQSDIAAAQSVGGRGTPTVVVNGLLLGQVPDVNRLEALLRQSESDGHREAR